MKTTLENTLYHSFLRIAICVLAVALVFDSGLLLKSTANISNQTQNYLASAVGVKVGVAPNEVNQLTGRITELETELAKERQISVNVGGDGSSAPDNSTFILSALLFIMLVLIVLNYALDYLRSRPTPDNYDKNTSPAT